MTGNEQKTQSMLLAQGLLIELLMLNLLNNQANPARLIETIRFQLAAQLHEDAARFLPEPPAKAAGDALVADAHHLLNGLLDRLKGQLLAPDPPKYSA
jgi:hypothetical protein